MLFRAVVAAFVSLLIAVVARAENPRFKFTAGETLTYKLVQTTTITDVVPDEKTGKPAAVESTTKLTLVRNWKVTAVDAQGTATIELSIASMRHERKFGNDVDVFDSANPDDLNKGEMAKHVGPTLATLRVDPLGKVVEVKESKIGAGRFEAELPFKVTLPGTALAAGDAWSRDYAITLDPPLGTGEKFTAKQTFTAGAAKDGLLPIAVKTAIADVPSDPAQEIPLVPSRPTGTVYLDVANGRYHAARLTIDRELKNHRGEGSSYKYASTYVEDRVPAK